MHFGKMYLLHITYHQLVLVIFVTIIKMSQRILIKHTIILFTNYQQCIITGSN